MSSSILISTGHTGHSSEVKMHLRLEGRILSVGQLGPDLLILDTAIDHPPGRGRLFFSVDRNEREWDIPLPEGLTAASRRVVIAKPD